MTALDREWRTAKVIWTRQHGPRIPQRGLWASWDDTSHLWLCHVAGYDMTPRQFIAATQTSILNAVQCLTWANRYRAKPVPGLWDGRPDLYLFTVTP